MTSTPPVPAPTTALPKSAGIFALIAAIVTLIGSPQFANIIPASASQVISLVATIVAVFSHPITKPSA